MRLTLGWLLAASTVLAPDIAASGPDVGVGVIVEEATPGFAAEKTGIVMGDVILGWAREANPPANPQPARGTIHTPFDLLDVETEEAPRGTLTLIGRRLDADMRWPMPADEWRLAVRPALPEPILEVYEAGKRRIEARELAEGVALWTEAARTAEGGKDGRLAAWLLLRSAEAPARDRQQDRVDELLARAARCLQNDGYSMEAGHTLLAWGGALISAGRPRLAKERYGRALELFQRLHPDRLAIAKAWHGLGRAEVHLADNTAAEAWHHKALALRERVAPESIATADSLSALGMLAHLRGYPIAAEDYLMRASRFRPVVPSLAHALDLSALAMVTGARGDYMAASQHLHVALPVLERLAPSSHELAYALHSAGLNAFYMGDLSAAEVKVRRALDIMRRLSGSDLRAGQAVRSLSLISWGRRDYALADSQGREALSIFEAIDPRSERVSNTLHLLGDIAVERGDLQRAEDNFRRALAIDGSQSLDGLSAADDLRCLGLVVARSGRLDEGEAHAKRSAAIRSRVLPGSHALSRSLMALAEIAFLRGRLDLAEKHYEEALAIRTRVVPGSRDEAEAYHGLGSVYRRADRLAEAAQSFERAIDALEGQRRKLGGSEEAHGGFSTAYSRYYQDAIETLIALQRRESAFRVLERSRVRSLLTALSERDLLFRADLPPDLARERKRNHAEYDHTQAKLARLDPNRSGAEFERLLGRLRELRSEGAEIAERVRLASPRLAALQYSQPLDAVGAAGVLDPETLFLAFAVGEARTLLFVLSGRPEGDEAAVGLSVFTLPVGRDALRERVESFRGLIAEAAPDQRPLRACAAGLYDLLLRPADAILASSTHLAISPDGPLHLLPFAALVREDAGRRELATPVWLTEWKPLSIVASTTHYAELKKARRHRRDNRSIVAFGDPRSKRLTSGGEPDSMLTRMSRRTQAGGSDLGPLPYSREECQAIVALFGKEATAYLGEEATETRVKTVARRPSYLHFATHAVIDENLPLNSALVRRPQDGDWRGERIATGVGDLRHGAVRCRVGDAFRLSNSPGRRDGWRGSHESRASIPICGSPLSRRLPVARAGLVNGGADGPILSRSQGGSRQGGGVAARAARPHSLRHDGGPSLPMGRLRRVRRWSIGSSRTGRGYWGLIPAAVDIGTNGLIDDSARPRLSTSGCRVR